MTIVGILFFGLMFVGLPIGYVLGLAGVAGLIQVGGENFLAMAPKRYFEGLDLFTFMAMPFFILAGEIMNRSGITMRLVAFTDSLVGYLRGGLGAQQHGGLRDLRGHDRCGRLRCGGLRQHPGAVDGLEGLPQAVRLRGLRCRLHHRPHHPALQPDGHLRLAHGGFHRRAVRGRDPAGAAHLPLLHVLHRGHRPAHRPAQGRRRIESVADRHLFQIELPRPAHAGHHPGRHPVRHRHPHRGGRDRRALRLDRRRGGLPGHHPQRHHRDAGAHLPHHRRGVPDHRIRLDPELVDDLRADPADRSPSSSCRSRATRRW